MRLHRPWSLRTRLITALLGFTAVGLTAFGGASLTLLDTSLVARVDMRLKDFAAKVSARDRPPPNPARVVTDVRLPTDFRVYYYNPDGTLRSESDPRNEDTSRPQLPPMDLATVRQRSSEIFTTGDVTGSGSWQVLTVVQQPDNYQPLGGTVAVAVSLASTDATIDRLAMIELTCGSILLATLGIIGLIGVRIGLRPLTRIEQTAQAIAGGDLERRVPDTDRRTETGRLGAALNVMLARISSALSERERSERRLRRFVADASHELRTPLTSIRGFAELYRRGGAPEPCDVERLMSRIESEATRMGLLVEDLLLLARLDQERSLDVAEVDLLVLAADAVHDVTASAPERPITLHSPHGPVRVLGDEHRLRQVVMNLVTNAVKHTPPDTPIRVSVRQEQTLPRTDLVAFAGGDLPPAPQFAVLEVTDEGPGIPADQGALVFDRFYRADQARTRAAGGSGLGLAITAAILEAHSGRIELSTTPGHGTSFRVLLSPH
ncbi:MAG: HAMP domain-containing histidine kinase [Kutzneria sp.]|nr:HAMP domain-containing histidine kinase [Kutzneria sp.]